MVIQDVYMTCGDNIQGETGHTSSRRGKVSGVYANINTCWGEACRIDGDIIVNDRKDEYLIKSKIKYWEEKGNPKKVKDWEQKLAEAIEYNKQQESEEKILIQVFPEWKIPQVELEVAMDGYLSVSLKQEDLKLLALIRTKQPEVIQRIKEIFETESLDKELNKYLASKV